MTLLMPNQKIHSASLCIFILFFNSTLIGCQKTDTPNSNTHKEYKNAQTNIPESNAPAITIQCEQVDATISKLKKIYSPENLIKLNNLFKECLATVPLKKRYEWLAASHKVYEIQISKLPINIQQYITQLSKEGNTLSKVDLKKLYNQMNHQEKYTIDHLKELYFYQYNEGEGYYSVSLDPKYTFEVFAPSLEKADQVFLKAQAEQEGQIGGSIDKDAGLSVTFTQLSQWIIFWENYLVQNPKSHFETHVQKTLADYQRYLFLGLENTPVFEINDFNVEMNPEARQAITQLAKTDSTSGKKAQKLLDYFDNYTFTETKFDEQKGTQQEYNLFLKETQAGIKHFEQNYSRDIQQRLKLKRPND